MAMRRVRGYYGRARAWVWSLPSRMRRRSNRKSSKILSSKNLIIMAAVFIGVMVWMNWDGIKSRFATIGIGGPSA